MPEFILQIKAELENIKLLKPLDCVNWKFDIESSSGETRQNITFSPVDEIELEGSRGISNFIIKWPGEREQAHIKIVPIKKSDGSYKDSDSEKFVSILGLECRGVIPTRWIPGEDFSAISSGGHIFEEVDMTDLSWADYDEKNDMSVSIMNLEHKIIRA